MQSSLLLNRYIAAIRYKDVNIVDPQSSIADNMMGTVMRKAPIIPKYQDSPLYLQKYGENHSCSVSTEGVQCCVHLFGSAPLIAALFRGKVVVL